jgi:hypothetical protein
MHLLRWWYDINCSADHRRMYRVCIFWLPYGESLHVNVSKRICNFSDPNRRCVVLFQLLQDNIVEYNCIYYYKNNVCLYNTYLYFPTQKVIIRGRWYKIPKEGKVYSEWDLFVQNFLMIVNCRKNHYHIEMTFVQDTLQTSQRITFLSEIK